MKLTNAGSLLELLFVRGLPGVLNLTALLLVASHLGILEYGRYSVAVATCTLIVVALYFPIIQSILPAHARYTSRGGGREFEASALGASACLSGAMLLGAAITASLNDIIFVSFVYVAGSGTLLTLLQILQARLQFWRYGAVAASQVGMFLALSYAYRDALSAYYALGILATTQLSAAALAMVLSGCPAPSFPSHEFRKDVRNTGLLITLGSLAENLLYVGFRWVIVGHGTADFLSRFSLAVDLVQRSVAVVLNLVGFRLVPRAYRNREQSSEAEFRRQLVRGALRGSALSLLMIPVVLATMMIFDIPALRADRFSSWMFAIVALAAVLNRARKIALDTPAVQQGFAWAIPISYVLAAPLALVSCALALDEGAVSVVPAIYVLGYVSAAGGFVIITRRARLKQVKGEARRR